MDYALRVAAVLTICCGLAAAASLPAPPPLLIKDKSYTIWAEMVLITPKLMSKIEVVETYSHWQNRSVLKYRVLDDTKDEGLRPDEAVVYMDKRQILLASNKHCVPFESELMDKMMNLNAFRGIAVEKAVVGPSKAAHIMSDRLGEFSSRLEGSALNGRAMREAIVLYSYELNEHTRAMLHYYVGTSNLPLGLPFEIVLTSGPNESSIVAYTFKRVDILPETPIFGPADSMYGQLPTDTGLEVKYDALAVQPDSGCGDKLTWASRESDANPLLATEYRFSFRARASMPSVGEPLVHYVVWEPSTKTLRVDKVQATRVSQTLVDYQAGELLHAVKRRAQHDLLLDHFMQTISESHSSKDLSCIRTQTPKGAVTLGKMLFGTDELSYLGLAEVRGIEARAYIAVNSSWPLWYEQQQVSHRSRANDSNSAAVESEIYTRPNTDGHEQSRLSTVFYLSNNAKQRPNDELSGQLILIEFKRELFLLDGVSTFESTSIPIYDFSWQLNSDAPDGQPMEQFLSLGDSCVSPATDDNHYAQLNLLLERNWPLARENEADWLGEKTRRNLALLAMVQERCGLPASMVFDLESRRVRGALSAASSLAQSFHIAATMRTVEHTRLLTKLIRLGRGAAKTSLARGAFSFPVALFQACYLIAAHMRFDAILFYSPTASTCSVFRASDLGADDISAIVDFGASRATIEVYRIEHELEAKIGALGDEITQLAHSQTKLRKLSKVSLMDGSKGAFEMALKSAEVRELDRKVPVEVDQVELADTDKFVGIGLVAGEGDDSPNWMIRPHPVEHLENGDQRWQKLNELATQMTVGWCEAECLAHFQCQSYSVCLRNSKVECVLSKVDFRTPDMLTQLAQLRGNRTKARERSDLRVDQLEHEVALVPVTKWPSCELRNKLYKQLFIEGKRIYVDVLRRRLEPVSGREQCAKLCVGRTIEALKLELQKAHKINAQAYGDPQREPHEIKLAFDELKSSSQNVCSSFLYLDWTVLLALSSEARLQLERLVGRPSSGDAPMYGYCILGDAPRKQEIEQLERWKALSRFDLLVERHDFDFSFMFEKHHDVSLASSMLHGDLRKALRAIQSSTAQEEDYALMRDHMSSGHNLALMSRADEASDCLRICFLQMSSLWPACKSVDVFEMDYKRGKETYCFYNSRTMRELLLGDRTDLLHTSAREQKRMTTKSILRMTHYEPKPGFIADSLGVMTDLRVSEAQVESGQHAAARLLKIGLFGLLCSVLLATIVGVSIGVALAGPMLEAGGKPREDAQILLVPSKGHLLDPLAMADLQTEPAAARQAPE